MQIRVVTAQPWEAAAELLVVPVVGEPDFDGSSTSSTVGPAASSAPWRRSESSSRSATATALAAPGDVPATRVLVVSGRPADEFDRETARRLAATAIRRLIGREVHAVAVWLAPIAEALDGDVALAAELVARGIVEGGFEPKTIYREDSDAAPPALDELVLLVGRRAPPPMPSAAPSAAGSSARAPTSARRLANRAANDVRPRSSPTRPAPSRRPTGCGSTSSTRSAPPSSAWACSWPWGRGATTRRG